MGDRVYPPQPFIHDARCEDAPPGLERRSPRAAYDEFPYAWRHPCVTKVTVESGLDCVIEPAKRWKHSYVRSSIWPADAIGPLCIACRGTHPESAIAARQHARPADNSPTSGIRRIP